MEDMENPIRQILNLETGEIDGELYPGDKIIRKRQQEYLKQNEKKINQDRIYNFGQDNNFSMLSQFSAKQLADEKLTASEYRILLIMISNTNYKSGLVAFKNNRPITNEWITKALKINKKTTDNGIRTLVDKGIIAQNITNNRTKYFFNPYIQYRGRWINRTLYEMFKNTKWAKSNTK